MNQQCRVQGNAALYKKLSQHTSHMTLIPGMLMRPEVYKAEARKVKAEAKAEAKCYEAEAECYEAELCHSWKATITDFTVAVAYINLKLIILRQNMKSVQCNKQHHEAGLHEAEAIVSRGRGQFFGPRGRGRSEDLTSLIDTNVLSESRNDKQYKQQTNKQQQTSVIHTISFIKIHFFYYT